jgi:hypothetical protein
LINKRKPKAAPETKPPPFFWFSETVVAEAKRLGEWGDWSVEGVRFAWK